MKTTGTLSLTHERVDDIPLLLGFMQALNFPMLLERHLGSHHLHRGLANGWLATVWLAFLLSQSNHRKVSVQDWARNHAHTLETLIGERLRPVEFGDDRLSIVLRRLHDADWSALEADLWEATCEVYEISYQCIRLDSTTSFGYHTITFEGLMQRGHSKDHRPDLPQLKLMAAAAQPTSHVLACDLVPGQWSQHGLGPGHPGRVLGERRAELSRGEPLQARAAGAVERPGLPSCRSSSPLKSSERSESRSSREFCSATPR